MGGLDIAAHEGGGGKKKGVLSHKKTRGRVAIDMTPFVDIAFLLLIFFMVTTVFRAPQAMEMNRPPKDAQVEVAESNVLILLVAEDQLEPIQMEDLEQFFRDQAAQNEDLTVLIKLHRDASYETMVDLMDEL